ncbi:MAG TPA: tetratricopeptide repeat protein [Verrucomicrobiae bacterium]|nr:tetratricopeptide repeat protein [Verrucomicrobiae bacterium]
MIEGRADGSGGEVPEGNSRWVQYGILGAVCALVIGLYAGMAQPGYFECFDQDPADAYYNLLVQGFRAGQLSLKKNVPPGLAQLADPYDPVANVLYRSESYQMHDLSYYKGRLYLYFGVTPALILFWPYVVLTGHYLSHTQAVPIFCAIGFLVSVGLLRAVWRRYFAEVSVGVVAAGALALGLAAGVPVLLARSDVYEVAVSCGYMLMMLVLGAIWCALHDPERRGRWLTMASAAYGLALGARPSLLFGAVILLVPVVQAWRERRRILSGLMAATGPILLIGLGLMFYNYLRFDDPFEFGFRYQLAADHQGAGPYFSLRYLWFNFQVYFLEPARWSGQFPFVREIALPRLPVGHNANLEEPFGILTNIPLVWLALAAPLACRGRVAEVRGTLCGFLAAVALFFGICVLTICLYFGACFRFEVEFLPALVLLAVVGVLGLERLLADWRAWRCAARWGWGLLLAFSVAFNVLANIVYFADGRYWLGVRLAQEGRVPEAIRMYEGVLRIRPNYAEAHNNLGAALEQEGRVQEAMGHYEQALHLKPDYAEAHNNLAVALRKMGNVPEAIEHWEQALRIKPDYAEVHYNLGLVLARSGRVSEAVEHWQQAVRLKPDYAEAHYNLGLALAKLGRVQEAIGQWKQALRINPDYAEAYVNLGVASERAGKILEAREQYEQALRINPHMIEAQDRLARLRAVQ